ncbi:hypothetical protein PCANC_17606 [Puccinia coronata f. sp. avenae]|uniref:Uncharacterized protein n=1 Tax=Puccinia coronata f. sp. avenae TaxID=200324 RepID=A0A2N5S868_9BASI|nr:hypothetical protein PCANC_17606 [Puccinia coronata f. sp. avenae]
MLDLFLAGEASKLTSRVELFSWIELGVAEACLLSLEPYTPATVRRDYPGRELGIIHEIALAGPGPKSNGPQILGKLTRPPRDFPQDLHVKILWRVRLDLGTRPGTSRDT